MGVELLPLGGAQFDFLGRIRNGFHDAITGYRLDFVGLAVNLDAQVIRVDDAFAGSGEQGFFDRLDDGLAVQAAFALHVFNYRT